ncbi:MAG: class I tRNA ligase family protein [Proteobacteria bacterium]|nr:class I tRNA ligase family protein [Pseudomonadota bacterium]
MSTDNNDQKPPHQHNQSGPPSIEEMKKRLHRPFRAVVTAGMPYASGPVHLGHIAGALVPPDICARWLRMLLGADKVLFISGSDDHGSTSELAATRAGKSTKDFIAEIHEQHTKTMERYHLSFDAYSGTSREECFPHHCELSQSIIRNISKNGMLEKKVSNQWYDPKINKFLQDRFISGKCPNPKCTNETAYSDQCDSCGAKYNPEELINPKSTLSDATPVLKPTTHWWLDLWKVSENLRTWVQSKEKVWRSNVYTECINTVMPALKFDNTFEDEYKKVKEQLPKHKSKYAAGKKIVVQCESKSDLETAKGILQGLKIPTEYLDDWAHRSISRDVEWGIPMPVDLDPEMKNKSLYVWPDSLIAPISFSKVALIKKNRSLGEIDDFWMNPDSRVYQFLGQDNVYFYTLMQGAMWFGNQSDCNRKPIKGELQLTDIFSVQFLMVEGEKMSKSKGNFFTADELIVDKGYTGDQIRYFVATLNLSDKPSNFDFNWLNERNKFLAGPLNAAFEKPISACHSKFNGIVPAGKLDEKVLAETTKMLQRYFKCMEKAEYPLMLGAAENYARLINSMFTQYKPHDDRAPENERIDALYSCFYVLKNLMIMLYPVVPDTMNRLRESLNLPETVFNVEELGTPILAGHKIGEKQEFFPAVNL